MTSSHGSAPSMNTTLPSGRRATPWASMSSDSTCSQPSGKRGLLQSLSVMPRLSQGNFLPGPKRQHMEIRICIDVDDLERGIAFYTQGLGLRVGRRLGDDWVELLGAGSAIDLLANPPGTAPLGENHPERRAYARHWTPVHLDFVVTGIDAAVQKLVSTGAALERPIQERRWGRMANMADPFGHGFDLLEFKGRGYDELLSPGALRHQPQAARYSCQCGSVGARSPSVCLTKAISWSYSASVKPPRIFWKRQYSR